MSGDAFVAAISDEPEVESKEETGA